MIIVEMFDDGALRVVNVGILRKKRSHEMKYRCGTYYGSADCDNCGECQKEKDEPNYDEKHDEAEEDGE